MAVTYEQANKAMDKFLEEYFNNPKYNGLFAAASITFLSIIKERSPDSVRGGRLMTSVLVYT